VILGFEKTEKKRNKIENKVKEKDYRSVEK